MATQRGALVTQCGTPVTQSSTMQDAMHPHMTKIDKASTNLFNNFVTLHKTIFLFAS